MSADRRPKATDSSSGVFNVFVLNLNLESWIYHYHHRFHRWHGFFLRQRIKRSTRISLTLDAKFNPILHKLGRHATQVPNDNKRYSMRGVRIRVHSMRGIRKPRSLSWSVKRPSAERARNPWNSWSVKRHPSGCRARLKLNDNKLLKNWLRPFLSRLGHPKASFHGARCSKNSFNSYNSLF